MPARHGRSGAIWAGAAASGLAHAGLIALALVAPPWLRPHRERPVPVVAVALVTPEAFEAATADRRQPEPAPQPARASPAAPLPAPPPAAAPDAAAAPPPAPTLPSLAPRFDAGSPLGLGPTPPPADLPAHRPRARPGQPGAVTAAPPADGAAAAAAFQAAVHAAVAERLGPADHEAGGTVRLALIVNREGRLLAARLIAASGSARLDRAAVEAARTALLPPMPDTMPNVRTTVEVELVFAPQRRGG
jgi:protein TonB